MNNKTEERISSSHSPRDPYHNFLSCPECSLGTFAFLLRHLPLRCTVPLIPVVIKSSHHKLIVTVIGFQSLSYQRNHQHIRSAIDWKGQPEAKISVFLCHGIFQTLSFLSGRKASKNSQTFFFNLQDMSDINLAAQSKWPSSTCYLIMSDMEWVTPCRYVIHWFTACCCWSSRHDQFSLLKEEEVEEATGVAF